MAKGQCVSLVLAVSLLANALSAPAHGPRWRRGENDIDSKEENGKSVSTTTYSSPSTTDPFDDDDDDFSDSSTSAPSGSNLFSLLRLAGALLPNLSNSNQQKIMTNPMVQKIIRELMKLDTNMKLDKKAVIQPRRDVLSDNEIIIDNIVGLKPPPFFQRQEIEESHENSSESNENDDDDDDDDDENNGAEEDSSEDGDDKSDENGNDNDKQDSDSDGSDGSDSDEPPESDGQGGGILGLLAGLSGGEDGQSDLGSLLAAVSGIVSNLSGDGIDINALIASGLGLFVGLLSEGEENPGAILASYLLTSLETLTGGGANNNGAFFGNFISKLVKGTSAAPESEDSNSNESGNKMPMTDSAGFFGSLIMSLLGDMSKTSSSGSSKPWRRGDLHSWQWTFN